MMIDILMGAVIVVLLVFPVAYAFYFKLEKKLLFLFACYGFEQIVSVLLLGLASPFILLSIFVFPQMQANGYMENITWLANAVHFTEDYWIFLTPIIVLVSPFVIQRRYGDVFISPAPQ